MKKNQRFLLRVTNQNEIDGSYWANLEEFQRKRDQCKEDVERGAVLPHHLHMRSIWGTRGRDM